MFSEPSIKKCDNENNGSVVYFLAMSFYSFRKLNLHIHKELSLYSPWILDTFLVFETYWYLKEVL